MISVVGEPRAEFGPRGPHGPPKAAIPVDWPPLRTSCPPLRCRQHVQALDVERQAHQVPLAPRLRQSTQAEAPEADPIGQRVFGIVSQASSTRENPRGRSESRRGVGSARRDAGTPRSCPRNRRATHGGRSRPPSSPASTPSDFRPCPTGLPRSQRKHRQGTCHSVSFPSPTGRNRAETPQPPAPIRPRLASGTSHPSSGSATTRTRLRVVPVHARHRMTVRLRKAGVPPRIAITEGGTPAASAAACRRCERTILSHRHLVAPHRQTAARQHHHLRALGAVPEHVPGTLTRITGGATDVRPAARGRRSAMNRPVRVGWIPAWEPGVHRRSGDGDCACVSSGGVPRPWVRDQVGGRQRAWAEMAEATGRTKGAI